MSKVLKAQCVSGVVSFQGIPIPDADILSAGVGPSSGVLLVDHDEQTYFASNASDLKTAIEKVVTALTNIATGLTAVNAGLTVPNPGVVTNVVAINLAATQLAALKEVLK